jgi:uncharacterized protein YjcR
MKASDLFVMALQNEGGGRPEPLRTHRRDIDWNAIERDYRCGSLSLRELAAKHGCSHSAIANFAGRHGWTRDSPLRPPVERKASQPTGESTCFISNMD